MKRLLVLTALCVAATSSMSLGDSETVTITGTGGSGTGGVGGGSMGGGGTGGTGQTGGGGTYGGGGSSAAVVALNAINLSTDVRCNPVAQANELIRTTTYAHDTYTKYLAANTLFRLIYAQLGGSAMQSALAIMPKAANIVSGGKSAVLWTTTWSDGSTSTFLVFPFLPPMFTDQQPEVRGDTPPSGSTACPSKG